MMTKGTDQESHQDRIERCQKTYNLSYHVPYAFHAEEQVGLSGMDVLEVGGSLPKDFVLKELNVKSWTCLESPEFTRMSTEERETGTREMDLGSTLPGLGIVGEGARKPHLAPGSFTMFYENIEDLPALHDSRYDRIFSVACFEHILRFPQALRRMYRALKVGGKLFTMFSPIWSSYNGHHLPPTTDAQGNRYFFNNSPIPPWGHLTMRPAQLREFLCQKMDAETAEQIVYLVHTSPHINRFFSEDYVQFVEQSPFAVLKLEGTFPAQLDAAGQARLERLFPGRKHFANNGMLMVLARRG